MTYFSELFSSFLKKMGIELEANIQNYGFYPKGGGRVRLRVHPGNLRPLDLTYREKFVRYDVLSVATEDLRSE